MLAYGLNKMLYNGTINEFGVSFIKVGWADYVQAG